MDKGIEWKNGKEFKTVKNIFIVLKFNSIDIK